MNPELRSGLIRLIGAQVSLHACMTGFRMAAPLMALREGHSPAAVGVLLALFALSQVFLALPGGRFTDRHGLKRPMLISVSVAMAGAGLSVAWPTFLVLCFTALTLGAATGLALIALQRHVGRLASNATELKQVFSWMAIGPSASNFLGPFLAGLLIDAAGFRAAFLVLALLPSLAWVWLRGVAELPKVPARTDAARRSSWDLLSHKGFRRLMTVNWILSSCFDVHTFLVPVIGHERGLSASAIGAIIGGFALAATAVRLLMPWVAARLREKIVITVSMLMTAVLFALYPLAQGALEMAALSALLGFSLGSVQPMILSTLHQMTPKDRHGEALGLRSMTINASSVLMPTLFGTVGALVGVASMFWVVGLVVGLGSRLAFTLSAPAEPPQRLDA